MNILVLHSSSDLYGASKILLQTVTHFSKKGNNVMVVLSEEGALSEALKDEGVRVFYIKLGILRRKYFNVQGLVNRITTIRKANKQIGEIVDQFGIDLIYSNTTGVLAGAFVAKKKKIRHVWHIHEIIVKPLWLFKALGWIINWSSDNVIVVSKAVEKHWQSVIEECKLCMVYNGLSYDNYRAANGQHIKKELSLSENDILVGMIGRVHPWKGQTYFLRIAKLLADQFSNVRFVMVGDAFPGNEYLYEELEKVKAELQIGDRVTDFGYRQDIPQILAGLDLFVLPSVLPDPLPTVVLEAMAAGKPVAATAHGGALEMVQNGVTGVWIPWDDAQRAATIIARLIANKTQLAAMGQKGAERVQFCFSEKAYMKNMEKIFFSSAGLKTQSHTEVHL